MASEQQILAACLQERRAYAAVAGHYRDEDLSPDGLFWWKIIKRWYEKDAAATSADRLLLAAAGKREVANPKHEERLLAYLRDLPAELPSAYNVAQDLLELRRHRAELEYAAAVASRAPLDKRLRLHKAAGDLLQATALAGKDLEAANDDATMITALSRANRIPLAPAALMQRTAGGATPGDHIVIFGRPEAGKSLFAVNLTAGFLRAGKRVLYIGNEESVYKTRQRIICNLANATTEQVEAHACKAIAIATERGFGGLDIRQGHPGSVLQINELLEATTPDILVLDQIRNLEAAGQEKNSLTNRLEYLATAVRAMLAEHHVVGVSVTQAGDKTERHGQQPPAWLTMADVDSSRTGLPAQADLLLGIGSDAQMRLNNERAVSICKNKLGHTHDGFIVSVDLQRSRIK